MKSAALGISAVSFLAGCMPGADASAPEAGAQCAMIGIDMSSAAPVDFGHGLVYVTHASSRLASGGGQDEGAEVIECASGDSVYLKSFHATGPGADQVSLDHRAALRRFETGARGRGMSDLEQVSSYATDLGLRPSARRETTTEPCGCAVHYPGLFGGRSPFEGSDQ